MTSLVAGITESKTCLFPVPLHYDPALIWEKSVCGKARADWEQLQRPVTSVKMLRFYLTTCLECSTVSIKWKNWLYAFSLT